MVGIFHVGVQTPALPAVGHGFVTELSCDLWENLPWTAGETPQQTLGATAGGGALTPSAQSGFDCMVFKRVAQIPPFPLVG